MRSRQIPRTEWRPFFDDFSRRNEGSPATIRVLHPSLGAQVEARELPLEGVVAPADPSGPISFHLGSSPQRHVEHEVGRPVQVWIEVSEAGSEDAVAVLSDDGTRTILELGRSGTP